MAKYAGPDTTVGAASPASTRFSVLRMARLLKVSTSGYYAYAKRAAATLTPRQQRRADLEVKIAQVHQGSRGTYGSPRITAELRGQGEVVTAKTVAKIMASADGRHSDRRERGRRWSSSWDELGRYEQRDSQFAHGCRQA